MAKRYVRAIAKSSQGDITKLCNGDEFRSPRRKADAIDDIDTGGEPVELGRCT